MVQTDSANSDLRALESLLAFWSEAGVETCVEDEPIDRMVPLAPPQRPIAPAALRQPAAAPESASPEIGEALEQARSLAAAAGDLAALAEAISAFDGCPLKSQGARQAVFSRGNPEGPVMVIGEGPGAEEDQQGAPFVGRAGKLLDLMLNAAGLHDRVFITNTVFWRPPGNRTPTFSEQSVCEPFVERAIELVRPKMLLLVGGASAKFMLKKDEGILSLRGRWHEWRDPRAELVLPALPTLHPAFLLRQPAAKKRAWSDLLTLTERLDRQARPD